MIETIKTRRSIRSYLPGAVDEASIRLIIEAAMYAPSARNLQSWHFIVVKEKESIQQLAGYLPNGKMLPAAGTAIVICADMELEPNVGYAVTNCAAATQNALLAIHSLGLGGVWLGVYPREERMTSLSEYFNLPSHIMPFSVIALGVSGEQPQLPERFRPERVHTETFGNL